MGPSMKDLVLGNYDGLEVSACIETPEYTERLEPGDDHSEASFWTVYGHCPQGGVEALWDFPSFKSAKAWSMEIMAKNPCLLKHGVFYYNKEDGYCD